MRHETRRASGAEPPGCAILSAAATGLVPFLRAQGADAERVIGAAGGSLTVLDEPAGRMDLAVYCRIFERAARETGNEHFGLSYGLQFEPAALGMLGYIALASPTLDAALENMSGLFHRHQQNSTLRVRRDGEFATLEYAIHDARVGQRRQDAELSIAMFCNVLRHALGRGWAPLWVGFEHACTGGQADAQDRLGAPVRYGCPTNAIRVRSADLRAALPGADARLLAILRQSISTLGLPPNRRVSLAERVGEAIRLRLADGEPALDDIAGALRLPNWTLQRRLRIEGSTYQEILSDVRRALALQYLRDPAIAVSELSFLLGYSELSAFSRAFHRWYATSPSQWRRANAAAGSG